MPTVDDFLNDDPWAVIAPHEELGEYKAIVECLSGANPEVIDNVLVSLKDQLKRSTKTISDDQAPHFAFVAGLYAQLAMLPLAPLNANHLHQLLPLINPLYPKISDECSPKVVLVVVRCLKVAPESTHTVLTDYLELLYDQDPLPTAGYLNFVAVMALLFPIAPEIITPIYTSHTRRHVDERLAETHHNPLVITLTLRLVLASCINDDARNFNLEYVPALTAAAFATNAQVRLLATVCIVKLWNFLKTQVVPIEKLALELMAHVDNEDAVEGLAYLTLNTKVKQRVRSDDEVIEKILGNTLKVPYGTMVILANITGAQTNTMKLVTQPNRDKTPDPQEAVDPFNRHLVAEHKVVSRISKVIDSQAVIDQVIVVIDHLATTADAGREIRGLMVQQGALNIVLNYLIKCKDGAVRSEATRALAKMAYSVNPLLAFKTHLAVSCVPYLVELLKGSDAETYMGLLALTNLALADDKTLKSQIVARCFEPELTSFIIDLDRPAVQRGAWELLLNLMGEPLVLAKFFNTAERENNSRFEIMVKMLHLTDPKLQTVIAGILANATSSFAMICDAILAHPLAAQLTDIIADILTTEAAEDELVVRVAYIVLNLAYAAGNLGKKWGSQLLRVLRSHAWSGDSKEILDDAAKVLAAIN